MKVKCGKLVFNIPSDKSWRIPVNTKKFIENSSEVNLTYKIQLVDNIKNNNEEIICQREDIVVGKNNKKLETRYLIIPGYFYPYAYYEEKDDKNISISILKYFEKYLTIDTIFWSLFALERHLIKNNSMIFHCSYIVYKNHAILFSGPSGIGKSTQADLWKNNRYAKIINGDRCLLEYENENWYANGWPVCGSSQICINEKYKLGSILFLKQGKENSAILLSKTDAIKRLTGQLTINYWNGDFVNRSISLAEDISNKINVYELTCTKDINAVEVLEKVLKENEEWMI